MRPVSLASQLAEVRSLLRTMCDRVYAAMGAIRAHLEAPDQDELMKVILLDNEVDKLEKTIDEQILYIFATQQPLGQELREAYASVKIAHQIERIGDAVESLARQLASGQAQSIDRNRLINRMLAASMTLFLSSYRAMFEGDFGPVIDIYIKDDEVDRLHRHVYTEAKALLRRPATEAEVDTALQLINIGNKLEKIADISCNWAEQIDFALHGMHRRRITRRPQRIVIIDNHDGTVAALVASRLNQQTGLLETDAATSERGFQITLATTTREAGIVSLRSHAVQVLASKGWVAESLPVLALDGMNWERTLVAIFLGHQLSDRTPHLGQARHKVVDLFWPEIDPSADLLGHLVLPRRSLEPPVSAEVALSLEGEPSSNAPPEDLAMSPDLDTLLDSIADRTSTLIALLGRMAKQSPQN